MKVNLISESQLIPKMWGGIHSAFLNCLYALQSNNVKVSVNSLGKSQLNHLHTLGAIGFCLLHLRTPTILTAHITPETHAGTFRVGSIGKMLTKLYLRYCYNKADLVIALNSKEQQVLKKMGVTTDIIVIPNPIDQHTFRTDGQLRNKGRATLNYHKDDFVILGVGHTVSRKGFDEFVAIAKELPHFKFLWVGGRLPFGESPDIDALLNSLPQNVTVTGYMPYDQMPMYYNAADLLLFPSHKELASMAIIEAAACGLPLLLRELPEYKELYGTHYIPCHSTPDFIDAIRLLQKNVDEYKNMVKKSHGLKDRFSLEHIGYTLLSAYSQVIKR